MQTVHVLPAQSVGSLSEGRSGSSGRDTSGLSLGELEQDGVKLGVEGWASLSAGIGSQRMPNEYLQELTAGDGDSHLVEFSAALQTVAKALRKVAESKKRAEDEAAEWKWKYEMELIRSKQGVQCPADFLGIEDMQKGDWPTVVMQDPADQQDAESQHGVESPQNGSARCCSKEGICSQQVIREQGMSPSTSEFDSGCDKRAGSQKASFRLAWGSDIKKSRKHKHDVVSFESGNITTAARSSKQITLLWESPPQSVFVLTKPDSASVAALCKEMVRWLQDAKGVQVFVESNVKKELLEDSSYFSTVQTCATVAEITALHNKLDLVITLGGDGTVLWAANMFKGPMPPLLSFAMGSLGFMTPFRILLCSKACGA